MSHNIDLNKLILTLEEIKSATRETADANVNQQLDDAIKQIQELQNESLSRNEVKQRVLSCLDNFFKALPSLTKLIDMWFSG